MTVPIISPATTGLNAGRGASVIAFDEMLKRVAEKGKVNLKTMIEPVR